MSDISRREFFIRTFKKPENPKITIGKISEFPVGQKRIFEKFKIEVESLPEGLRVKSTEDHKKYFSLKTTQTGEIEVNREEVWSPSLAFSILTNESIFLDTSLEDRI